MAKLESTVLSKLKGAVKVEQVGFGRIADEFHFQLAHGVAIDPHRGVIFPAAAFPAATYGVAVEENGRLADVADAPGFRREERVDAVRGYDDVKPPVAEELHIGLTRLFAPGARPLGDGDVIRCENLRVSFGRGFV